MSLTSVPASVKSGTGWHWDGNAVIVDSNNVTLSGLDIAGSVRTSKSGLIVKNTRIRCANEQSWCLSLGGGATVTDTEIGGGASGSTYLPAIGVLSGSYNSSRATSVLQRVEIHHTVHGMRVDGDTTLVDSYIHNMPMGDPGFASAHSDGIMCTAGANVTIRHNRIETGNTSTFFVQWQSGNVGISNYLIENNAFVGISKNGQQSSYGVMIENKGISGPVTVRNNTFAGEWQAGAILAPRSAAISGNRYTDGKPASVEYR